MALGKTSYFDCFKSGEAKNGLRTWTGIMYVLYRLFSAEDGFVARTLALPDLFSSFPSSHLAGSKECSSSRDASKFFFPSRGS